MGDYPPCCLIHNSCLITILVEMKSNLNCYSENENLLSHIATKSRSAPGFRFIRRMLGKFSQPPSPSLSLPAPSLSPHTSFLIPLPHFQSLSLPPPPHSLSLSFPPSPSLPLLLPEDVSGQAPNRQIIECQASSIGLRPGQKPGQGGRVGGCTHPSMGPLDPPSLGLLQSSLLPSLFPPSSPPARLLTVSLTFCFHFYFCLYLCFLLCVFCPSVKLSPFIFSLIISFFLLLSLHHSFSLLSASLHLSLFSVFPLAFLLPAHPCPVFFSFPPLSLWMNPFGFVSSPILSPPLLLSFVGVIILSRLWGQDGF